MLQPQNTMPAKTSPDFSTYTLEELYDELDSLEEEMVRIQSQLDRAKSDAAETQTPLNRQWFLAAQYARRIKGVEHQRVQREIGRRKRIRASSNGKN